MRAVAIREQSQGFPFVRALHVPSGCDLESIPRVAEGETVLSVHVGTAACRVLHDPSHASGFLPRVVLGQLHSRTFWPKGGTILRYRKEEINILIIRLLILAHNFGFREYDA